MAGGDARRRRTPDRRGSSRLTGPRLLDRLGRDLLDAGLRPGRGVRDVLPHRGVELADEDDSSDHERRENGEEDAIQGQLPGLAGAVALADDGPALVLAHRVDLGLVVAGQTLLHGLALDDRVGAKRRRRDPLLGSLAVAVVARARRRAPAALRLLRHPLQNLSTCQARSPPPTGGQGATVDAGPDS